jgi:hypothetical protein
MGQLSLARSPALLQRCAANAKTRRNTGARRKTFARQIASSARQLKVKILARLVKAKNPPDF